MWRWWFAYRNRKRIVILLFTVAVFLSYWMQGNIKRESVQDELQEQCDYLSHITLKPEVSIQLNLQNVSKRKYAITIDSPYLIENPYLCKAVDNLTVLVVVHSAVQHFEHRRVIRETWTNNSYFNHLGTIRVVFLLGRSINDQPWIDNEFKRYSDILQGDFIDAYRNLTHKNVMGLKWVSERCKNAKIILKVDDDVVIDMFYFLTHFVRYLLSKPYHMACDRIDNAKVKRHGKWAVDETLFRNDSFYPCYCQGFVVAITNDLIPALYKSATITPFFWIDDIYSYGILPGNIPEIVYTKLEINTDYSFTDSKAVECYKRNVMKCPYFVVLVSGNVPEKLNSIWSYILRKQQK